VSERSRLRLGNWLNVHVLLIVTLVTGWGGAAFIAPAAGAQEELVFCSDIAYPPMEFFEGSEAVGADIDIGNEIAARLGRTPVYSNVGFDGIVAALLGNQCEAIISSMNNTPERAEQVDFVNYLLFGQSLMVAKGNPLGLSDLASLCGHAAAAQVGTTNLDALELASEECEAAGEEPIDSVGFPSNTDAVLALKSGQVDSVETDSPVAAYYVAQDPDSFELTDAVIDPILVGIAFNKDNAELRDQVQIIIDEMYADGTMMGILETWELTAFALPEKVGATPVATPVAA
jgi:polar amino acid transport system substrate-binding protein